jgi:hypothetical protein
MRAAFLAPALVFIGVILIFAGAAFGSGGVLSNPTVLEWIQFHLPGAMFYHGAAFLCIGMVMHLRSNRRT